MITEKAIALIKHYESLHDGDLTKIGLQPKRCAAGYFTVGYGHVVIDPMTNQPLKEAWQKDRALELYPALTEAEAERLLMQDIEKFEAIVRGLTKHPYEGDRLGALVSFIYNVGVGNFQRSTLLKRLNLYKIEEAGDQLLRWDKGTVNGKLVQLPGLVARRKSERRLFLTGTLKFYN